MKFKMYDSFSDSEAESDWDTAIDLVTSTTAFEEFLLQAEGGAIIHIGREIDSSSRQYLEPDFDEEDKTGEIGPYVLHDSYIPKRSKVTYQEGRVVSVMGIEPITVAEFQAYHDDWDDLISIKVNRFHSQIKTPGGPLENNSFSIKEIRGDGVYPSDPWDADKFHFQKIGLNAEIVKQIFEAMPAQFSYCDGPKEFEITLPPEIETRLRTIGLQQDAYQKQKPTLIIENMAREANATVGLMIESMAHDVTMDNMARNANAKIGWMIDLLTDNAAREAISPRP